MANELQKNDPSKARQYFADKMSFTTGPVELSRNLKRSDLIVVDVREAADYDKGHIPGSINLPHAQWNTAAGLRKDALHVVVCYTQQCHLAATAALEFATKGFSVMELDGGFEAWKENELEVETGAARRSGKPVSMPA